MPISLHELRPFSFHWAKTSSSRRTPNLSCFAVIVLLASGVAHASSKDKLTVAANGSGDYRTVQEAVDAVPENNTKRVIIRIMPGTYKERISVPASKPFITLKGDDSKTTVLTFNLSAKDTGNTRLSMSTHVLANNFEAENITFENTYGTGSQAVAMYSEGDRVYFRNCRFIGWQDTLFINGGRYYIKNCYIEGHVDFIFGSASAVFQDCEIHSRADGYVTAHYRLSNDENTGFVFIRCKLTASGTNKGSFLGRPWRPYARVVYLNCWIGDSFRPEGWDNWRDPEREKTAFFAEYKSRGPGANSATRVKWSRQLTSDEAKLFAAANFLRRDDNWRPWER